MENKTAREVFREATEYYVATVSMITSGQWDSPGLGVWNVRDLVGHTSRALLTVEQYSAEPLTGAEAEGPVSFFLRAFNEADSNEIADRGKESGEGLGADPAQSLRSIADRVSDRMGDVPDEAVLGTPRGPIRMIDYLETRVFELTIHTMDIQTAVGQPLTPPQSALQTTMRILGDLVLAHGKGAEVALTLTGRQSLSSPFRLLP